MKRIMHYIIVFSIFFATLSFSSCRHDKDEPEPVPTTVERTVLTYIVAANNLGQDGGGYKAADSLDIREMQTAAQNGDLGNNRWIIYHSTYSNSRLYELKKDGLELLKEYPAGLSVSIERMENVIADTKEFAPANNYGMVLWSHATGWIEDGIKEEPEPEIKPLSYGIHSGKKMNITSLRRALTDKGIDYLYFDCCLMGSIEVAYELRDCVRYIVASPSELLREGMPYNQNVKPLLDGSRQALIQAASNTFTLYASMPNASDRTCTMSVYDTEHLDELATATKAIYELTPCAHPLTTVTDYYRYSPNDYLDFGEYVEALCNTYEIDAELLNNYNSALDKAVIYKNATEKLWNDWPMTTVSGFSTRVFKKFEYFSNKGYNNLQWAKDVVSFHNDNAELVQE